MPCRKYLSTISTILCVQLLFQCNITFLTWSVCNFFNQTISCIFTQNHAELTLYQTSRSYLTMLWLLNLAVRGFRNKTDFCFQILFGVARVFKIGRLKLLDKQTWPLLFNIDRYPLLEKNSLQCKAAWRYNIQCGFWSSMLWFQYYSVRKK